MKRVKSRRPKKWNVLYAARMVGESYRKQKVLGRKKR